MTLQNKILTLLQDPENRKIVNEGQPYFEVAMYGDNLYIENFSFFINDTNYESVNFNLLSDIYQFMVIRYCIKLLPAFQVENKECAWISNTLHESYKWLGAEANKPHISIKQEDDSTKDYWLVPQTLAEALLKCGAMTVSELEAEYERLTK
jgi:hypothetical protein